MDASWASPRSLTERSALISDYRVLSFFFCACRHTIDKRRARWRDHRQLPRVAEARRRRATRGADGVIRAGRYDTGARGRNRAGAPGESCRALGPRTQAGGRKATSLEAGSDGRTGGRTSGRTRR